MNRQHSTMLFTWSMPSMALAVTPATSITFALAMAALPLAPHLS